MLFKSSYDKTITQGSLDRLRWAFFWKEGRIVTGGQCLVSWDVMCSPRGAGGLGM